ncbi:hypothetical protein C0J52_20747, partial [Blattella germanica]
YYLESARIVTWRYWYLNRLNELRTAGCPIIFIDETWYDTHDVVRKGWGDGTCFCCLQAPSSRGKRIMILHAGSSDGWVPECLYLSSKSISDSMADSHDEMNAKNHGHEVLRLPPYHCTLNPIELVWARLKTSVRRNNVTPSMTNSVCSVLRQCVDGIDATLWGKCVQHTLKLKDYTLCRIWKMTTGSSSLTLGEVIPKTKIKDITAAYAAISIEIWTEVTATIAHRSIRLWPPTVNILNISRNHVLN